MVIAAGRQSMSAVVAAESKVSSGRSEYGVRNASAIGLHLSAFQNRVESYVAEMSMQVVLKTSNSFGKLELFVKNQEIVQNFRLNLLNHINTYCS